MLRSRSSRWLHVVLSALVLASSFWLSSPAAVVRAQTPDQIGEWGAVLNWGIQGKHMVLMPNGNVLVWSTGDNARVWNPQTGTFTQTPALFGDLHCAGQTTLADGRVIVIGGQNGATHNGITVNALFDPYSNTWTEGAPMAYQRWYPTATALPDGRVLATSGDRPDGTRTTIPEIYDPNTNTWTQLSGANREQGLYPFMFVLPDGRLYEAGTYNQTYFLDTATQTWTNGPINTFGSDSYAESSAMYAPGKILRAGGGDPAFANAATIDLSGAVASPQWKTISSMAFPRRRHNLVIMADGQVMAIGGTRQADSDSLAILEGEIWNPTSEQWTMVAPMSEARMYHSSALLLPDGRIVTAGGEADGRLHAQIYSPPYLFQGPRPTITSSPELAAYGSSFEIGTPNPAAIASVALIRPGAVTHAFDENQRYVPLNFSQTATGLAVTAPADGNVAPPGYYMLVIKDISGVPSVASWLRVDSAASLAPGTISGRVTDKNTGLGVGGATVAYSGGSTVTDQNGNYTLTGVLLGSHRLAVAASGYASKSASQYVTAGGSFTLDFALVPPSTVSGKVTQSGTSTPIAGATITYADGIATTDANGNYTLSGIESGSQSLAISATGYQINEQVINAPANGTLTLDVSLTPKPTYIAGEVRDSLTNQVIVGANVTFSGGMVATDSLGRYQTGDTAPGIYTVTVSAPGYIDASQNVVVTLGAYTISDFLIDPVSAAPLVFTPAADTYIDAKNPSTNYGTSNRLKLYKYNNGPIFTSYLRFDIAGLTRQIQSAKLRLYVQNGADKSGAIYKVANTAQGKTSLWQDAELTQQNAPALNGQPLSTVSSITLGTWIEYDVTAALTGNGDYSFAIKPRSVDMAEFSSKEDSAHAPQLVVRQVIAPAPAITSFTPPNGPAGTEVTIEGSGFDGVTTVAFNGQPAASYVVDSAARIRAVVPAGATSGVVSVITAGGTANSSNAFVVSRTPPPAKKIQIYLPLTVRPAAAAGKGGSVLAAPALAGSQSRPVDWFLCYR